MNETEMFKKYEKDIKKISFYFSYRRKIDIDEVFSIAYESFMHCAKNYNENLGSFVNYLINNMSFKIRKHSAKNILAEEREKTLTKQISNVYYDRHESIFDNFKDEKIKYILSIIFYKDEEFEKYRGGKKLTKTIIFNFLLNEKKWKRKTIKYYFYKIKEHLHDTN